MSIILVNMNSNLRECENMKKSNILFTILLGMGAIIIGIILFLYFTFSPTADTERNLSFGDVGLSVEIEDGSFVKPIVRTYALEKYQSFSEKKQRKIQEQTLGKIEGDIPCVYLDGNKESLKFSFTNNGVKAEPNDVPEIKLIAYPSHYEDESPERVITDKLLKNESGEYFYTLRRYRTQYEKYFLETNYIQLIYNINGKEYISFFSLHTSTSDADFFENEILQQPIPAEK